MKPLKNLNFKHKIFLFSALLALIIIALYFFSGIRKLYFSSVSINEQSNFYLYIPTGSSIEDVSRILTENKFITNKKDFEWVAKKKKYSNRIKPGKYKLKNGMSNNELVLLLRSGKQELVKLKFNNIRTKEQLAGNIARQIEADSASIVQKLTDNAYLQSYEFNSETVLGMFIPNTYEFFWNTSADAFIKRMHKEYTKFWNISRIEKAQLLNMKPIEVITLAAIIDEESNMTDEYPTLAGVYINRLKRGMPLQADPTVKFALGDFTIKRILLKHLEINSPYNTYKKTGLPPGPIVMPSVKAIDAVLDYEKHSYLYFCAKSDFSGYHTFAKTLIQHNQNAADYQRELNKRKIWN